ncbi:hypothetical protein BJ875DRAFT_165028 [Amylocarpus encephaloides]|uniref:DUF221-domain-containing protein n=1 Tax=Amylocarpus encephaloides TaxID=45428 RepID=A0A9P8C8F4_9HELO|nr:hypothetical protein BJ875DRAFT_165028 [Amylocarpus encephaloides]
MSTSETASSGTSSTWQSNSVSGFLSTLIPVGLVAVLSTGLFFLLRNRFKRVYRPRTYLGTLYEEEKTTQLPEGRFNWLKQFRAIPDEYVLSHQSLDGYLYLRFLKVLMIVCFVGCCITWPVLFPVNATGGGGQTQFDLLSFSNINDNGKNRYYAHVFIAWIFFSFVMLVITWETIYYINLRRAYLLAPFNAARISSRTVVFTDVPDEYLKRESLQKLFGASMRRVWLSTDCKDLDDLLEERDKNAIKLEGAEIKLCQVANKRRLKWEKKNDRRKDASPENEEVAMAGSRYQREKDRPIQRLGKIPCMGHEVDTIEYTRSELRRLIPEIQKQQAAHQKLDSKILPSIFVEFSTQQAAEGAFRRMNPRKDPRMYPRAISAAPSEVIWGNLRITKKERMLRKLGANTFLTLMIVFWSIPVAVVGAISNINYLTDKVPFLGFINDIPSAILGVVTGLLPSLMLSILMALVPIVCRLMMKLSGEVTLPDVELKTQTWYMAFQVIQVFLVTTFSSGAASVVTQIINDPGMATTLLAQNLPKASNFYISYIIIQGLGIAGATLLNIVPLLMLNVVGKLLDKSPRKMFQRYITLSGLGWGSLYPKIGNLGIIAITYSIISPLVLGFATIGFALLYLAVRYNSLFVLTNNVDTKGLAYAKALQQLMVGVYLSEVCLIGLFAINTSPGPIILMAGFLVATAIFHLIMHNALGALTQYLPESVEGSDQREMFTMTDNTDYDASKASAPPTESQGTTPKPTAAKKAALFSRFFDPTRFKSHSSVQKLVPAWDPVQYEPEDAEWAYYNPSISAKPPVIWIARDEMGISQREIRDLKDIMEMSDEYARFNEKGNVVWDSPEEGGNLTELPLWEKRVDY